MILLKLLLLEIFKFDNIVVLLLIIFWNILSFWIFKLDSIVILFNIVVFDTFNGDVVGVGGS